MVARTSSIKCCNARHQWVIWKKYRAKSASLAIGIAPSWLQGVVIGECASEFAIIEAKEPNHYATPERK